MNIKIEKINGEEKYYINCGRYISTREYFKGKDSTIELEGQKINCTVYSDYKNTFMSITGKVYDAEYGVKEDDIKKLYFLKGYENAIFYIDVDFEKMFNLINAGCSSAYGDIYEKNI